MPLTQVKVSGGRNKWTRDKSGEPRAPQPVPQDVVHHGARYSIVQKVQALTLLTEGFTVRDVQAKTGIPERTLYRIKATAKERGFQPEIDPRITEAYVEDGERPGRPREINEAIEQRLLANVRENRSGREKSSEVLAYEVGISRRSAIRILYKYGLTSVKPTRKPSLTKAMRAARLKFALSYAHWTLEDWKNVIWTDETSVILGHRRGSVRLWRDSKEAYEATVIRSRWKGFSEFMFWGSFTWYEKGPCHIWKPETTKQRTLAEQHLAEINKVLEAEMKAQWEMNTGMNRLKLRGIGGVKPSWRWTKKTGKLVRDGKGGIDWYRYWQVSNSLPT
jgi:transposase